MTLVNIVILAIVQGLAELLPVSSSAHVVVAEKMLHLDPSSPPMTLLLIMLHTGTMFAVIVYFWSSWRRTYFQSRSEFVKIAARVLFATAVTGVVGYSLQFIVVKTVFAGVAHAEIEDLFSHLEFIAPALAVAGVLILLSGLLERRRAGGRGEAVDPDLPQAGLIGFVQGLCLPFRGLSRSGATISMGMLLGITKARVEAFSFALAVVLTPPVVVREALRLVRAQRLEGHGDLGSVAGLSVLGAAIAFLAGLVALKWLSGWLEGGRWYLFGIYCLAAAGGVYWLHGLGY